MTNLKAVLRFLTACKVLEASTFSKRLWLGELSLGKGLLHFSANSLVASRTRSQNDLRSLGLPAKLCLLVCTLIQEAA